MTNKMMEVICISNTSINTGNKLPIDIGQTYFINKSSIYMDEDGDAFGIVYTAIVDEAHPEAVKPSTIVGSLALKHFKSVI